MLKLIYTIINIGVRSALIAKINDSRLSFFTLITSLLNRNRALREKHTKKHTEEEIKVQLKKLKLNKRVLLLQLKRVINVLERGSLVLYIISVCTTLRALRFIRTLTGIFWIGTNVGLSKSTKKFIFISIFFFFLGFIKGEFISVFSAQNMLMELPFNHTLSFCSFIPILGSKEEPNSNNKELDESSGDAYLAYWNYYEDPLLLLITINHELQQRIQQLELQQRMKQQQMKDKNRPYYEINRLRNWNINKMKKENIILYGLGGLPAILQEADSTTIILFNTVMAVFGLAIGYSVYSLIKLNASKYSLVFFSIIALVSFVLIKFDQIVNYDCFWIFMLPFFASLVLFVIVKNGINWNGEDNTIALRNQDSIALRNNDLLLRNQEILLRNQEILLRNNQLLLRNNQLLEILIKEKQNTKEPLSL